MYQVAACSHSDRLSVVFDKVLSDLSITIKSNLSRGVCPPGFSGRLIGEGACMVAPLALKTSQHHCTTKQIEYSNATTSPSQQLQRLGTKGMTLQLELKMPSCSTICYGTRISSHLVGVPSHASRDHHRSVWRCLRT